MTSAELQATLDKWALHVYGQNPHSGLNGRTPNQQAALYGGHVRRISNERALDMLLSETAATRCINKKGIRFNGRNYIAPELAKYTSQKQDSDNLKAVLKYDESDIGRLFVYVDGEYVCVAECPDITGISRSEVATVTKKAIKKALNKQAGELKAYKKLVSQDIVGLVIQDRADNSGNVTFMPRPAKEHSTPALEQAAIAAGNVTTPSVATSTPSYDYEAEKAKVIAFLSSEPEVNPLTMNDAELWSYWNKLDKKQREGVVLSEKELSFYGSFQRTLTYKTFLSVHADLAIKR